MSIANDAMLTFTLTLLMTGIVGWVGYFIKRAIDKNEKHNDTQDVDIAAVAKELSDLKSDLPFVYVTREDYIRGMNNIDTTLNGIYSKLDKIYDQIIKGGGANG